MNIGSVLFQHFRYSGLSKEAYIKTRPLIKENNRKLLIGFSILVAIAFFILAITSFFVPSLEKNRAVYVVCAVAGIITLLISVINSTNRILQLFSMYVFIGILYFFGIYLGTFVDPTNVSVSFPVILFAAPLLFTDIPLRQNIFSLFAIVAYCIIASFTQTPTLIEYNLSNVIPFGLISIIVSSYGMRMKTERFYFSIVSKERLTEISRKAIELKQHIDVVDGLTEQYTTAFSFDLEKGTYEVIKELPKFRQILGDNYLISESFSRFINACVAEDYIHNMLDFCDPKKIQVRLTGKKSAGYEFINKGSNYGWTRMDMVTSKVDAEGVPTRVLCLFKDVTEEVNSRNKLQIKVDLFERDQLTGLLNRQGFLYRAEEMIKANPNMDFDIIISDILGFKEINANFGSAKGDEVLVEISKSPLKDVPNVLTARYGGNQFVCMIPANTLDYDRFSSMTLEDLEHKLHISRIVIKNGVYRNIDKNLPIVDCCEKAIWTIGFIKKSLNTNVAFFEGQLKEHFEKEVMLQQNFHQALMDEEFIVYYQPKINPKTNKMVGAEALVRWQTKEGKLISPADFIPLFERKGQIVELDEYVFRHVCQEQALRKRMGFSVIPVSINLSRNSIGQSNLIKKYRSIVDEYRINPSLVPIEITESAAVSTSEIESLIKEFKAFGFSLHMDDFGVGQSTIVSLGSLCFDVVKLDKSIIDEIGDEKGEAIIKVLSEMIKNFGMEVVAEGVEKEDQVKFLESQGITVIQGYYYSKPLPLEQFETFAENH